MTDVTLDATAGLARFGAGHGIPEWLSVDNLPGADADFGEQRMSRVRHPDKDIEAALRFAEARGWRLRIGGSHAWGRMYCPYNDSECRCGEFCVVSIWSTPRSGRNHAKALRRVVENCSREQ